MFHYNIKMIDYLYRPLKDLIDTKNNLKLIYDGQLIEYANKYRELTFRVPYFINQDSNPLIDELNTETILQYSDSNNKKEKFIIKSKDDVHSESELCSQYLCIPLYVERLSKLGLSKTVGNEDAAPLTSYEWAQKIVDGTGWTINIHEDLYEDITIRNSSGELVNVRQIKRRTLNLSNSNCYNMLQELQNIFECHITYDFDNKQINIYARNDVTHNVLIEYGKNLVSINRLKDGDKIVTKLYAYGGEHPTTGLVNISSVNPTLEPYILNFNYYKSLGYFTDKHQSLLDGYNEKLTNLNLSLLDVVNKKIPLDTEVIDLNAQIYTYQALVDQFATDIANKNIEIEQYASDSSEYANISSQIAELTNELNLKTGLLNSAKDRTKIVNEQILTYENIINSILSEKSAIYEQMNRNLGQFIKEGIFQDQNYMYSENLYADALSVSERVAYPELSYKIDILLLQDVEGFKLEEIHGGDNLLLTDDELGISRLPIVISKIEYNLDNLLDSSIEVSTVISDFEDLYEKIMRTTTLINAKSESYNRAAGAFNGDGTLKNEILANALASRQYNTWLNSIGTVRTSDEGVFIYEPILVNGKLQADTSNPMKIIGTGIQVKTDTGWDYILKRDGTINANYLLAGKIDVEKVIIRHGNDPAFSWNKNGLIAYDYNESGISSYSNYAKFYKNGLELYQNNNIRAIYGRLPDGNYGEILYDNVGNVTLRTSDEGDLWLQKYISVGGLSPSENLAGISGVGIEANSIRFWSGTTYENRDTALFRVQSDGAMYAEKGFFVGEIHASAGSIDQYINVGDNIIIDSGKNEDGEQTRKEQIYTEQWSINGDGSAYFNNVRIRGIISASVFSYDRTSINAGTLMIMNANILAEDLVISSLVEDAIIKLNGTDTALYSLFKVNDILSIQVIDENNLRVDYWFKITEGKTIDGNGDIKVIPIAISSLNDLPTGGLFKAGLTVINYGHEDTSTGIRLVGTSSVEKAPFIDMFSAEKQVNETYNIGTSSKLRIGLLDGINDTDFKDMYGNPLNISGYGLYAENVYLKGSIVAENAIIMNSLFSGGIVAGTIDSGNVYIRDRSVEGSENPDGWYFVIYPDDENNESDKTKYRFLSYETGIFIRNYDFYFYHDDGLSIETDNATGLISPSNDLLLFKNIGNYLICDNCYFTSLLSNNTLKFLYKEYAGTPNINDFDLSITSIFEVGANNAYGFLGTKENTNIIFGIRKIEDDITQIDFSKNVYVGFNIENPIHSVHSGNTIGAEEGYYFTDSDDDKLKIIKQYDAESDSFCIDFYVL